VNIFSHLQVKEERRGVLSSSQEEISLWIELRI